MGRYEKIGAALKALATRHKLLVQFTKDGIEERSDAMDMSSGAGSGSIAQSAESSRAPSSNIVSEEKQNDFPDVPIADEDDASSEKSNGSILDSLSGYQPFTTGVWDRNNPKLYIPPRGKHKENPTPEVDEEPVVVGLTRLYGLVAIQAAHLWTQRSRGQSILFLSFFFFVFFFCFFQDEHDTFLFRKLKRLMFLEMCIFWRSKRLSRASVVTASRSSSRVITTFISGVAKSKRMRWNVCGKLFTLCCRSRNGYGEDLSTVHGK